MKTILACIVLASTLSFSFLNHETTANVHNLNYPTSSIHLNNLEIISIKELSSCIDINELYQGVKEVLEVTYNGRVVPPTEYKYDAVRNGKKYSGVLALKSYKWKDGKTIATYSGTLSPVE